MERFDTSSIALAFLLAAVLVALPACEESTSVSPDDDLIVNLTDDAAGLRDLDSVEIRFDRVEVFPVRGVSRSLPLVLPDNPVDVLELRRAGGIVPLASGDVPETAFRGLRVTLEENGSRVVEAEGDRKNLKLSREEIEIPVPFRVEDDRVTRVTLDLDLGRSLLRSGDEWILDPVFEVSVRD